MGNNSSKTLHLLESQEEAAALSPPNLRKYETILREQLLMVQKALENSVADRATEIALGVERHDAVFKSEYFTDDEILAQLVDPRYQTTLGAHNWQTLCTLGPCFVGLAKAGKAGRESLTSAMLTALQQQEAMPLKLRQRLAERFPTVLSAMREIAESYLLRGKRKPDDSDSGDGRELGFCRSTVLQGASGIYRPVAFINSGSAGTVFSGVKVSAVSEAEGGAADRWRAATQRIAGAPVPAAGFDVTSGIVLKRINRTQADSAENEFSIASRVAQGPAGRFCVSYLDRVVDGAGQLWLVLQRVRASSYGVDLAEYICNGFFQQPGRKGLAREAVLQLLRSLVHIGAAGVVMRDVKPDNVLVEFEESGDGQNERIHLRWTDFGLAVDLADGGTRLRRPAPDGSERDLAKQLVGWWYDTQKQVPKPKWRNRCPPERCYQEGAAGRYDVYMLGIIFCCIATGIDWPHLGSKVVDGAVEGLVGEPLPSDYLECLELGSFMQRHQEVFESCFVETFGGLFGPRLFSVATTMLETDPHRRASPEQAIGDLGDAQGAECGERVPTEAKPTLARV